MKILILFIFISFNAIANTYQSYEIAPINSEILVKIEKVMNTFSLTPLDGTNANQLKIFGVNQIFVNHDYSQMVFYKYDVETNLPLETWVNLTDGRVIHFLANGKKHALFVKNFTDEKAMQVFSKIKELDLNSKTSSFNFINTVNANDCVTSAPTPFIHLEKITSTVVFDSLSACLRGTADGAYSSTIGVGEMAWNGAKAVGNEVKDLFTNPNLKIDQYYSGVVKGVGTLKNIINYIAEMAVNPDKANQNFTNLYGEAGKKITEIFSGVKNLPAPVMLEFSCSLITGIGIDALIAYLTVGGGSAKLALTLTRIASESILLNKVATILKNGMLLSKEKLQLLVRKISQDKIPKEDVEFLKDFMGKTRDTDKTAMEALACYIN